MIKDGKRYLNLEDQVEWNKNHIEAFLAGMETVNIFGIRVLAVVATPEDIPLDETYSYGDAYAVGTNPPYHYYVYTRSGLPAIEGTFVDIGEFPGKGEKGDKGDPGENGTDGKTPYIGANEHWWIGGVDTGVSARGPAGIGLRGPQGERGEAGGYKLYGELTSDSQLPTPTKTLQNDSAAYVINGDLWMVMGLTAFEWYNLGKIGGTGLRGEPGVGIDTMTKMTTPYGEGTVTYDTTDGIHLTGLTRIDYGDDFSKGVDTDTALPIKAGVGVSMDATEDSKHIEIKADETWINNTIDEKVVPLEENKRDIVAPAAMGGNIRLYSVSPATTDHPEGEQAYIETAPNLLTQNSIPQRTANGQINLPNQLTYVPTNHQAVSKIYVDTGLDETKTLVETKLNKYQTQSTYVKAVPIVTQYSNQIGAYEGMQELTTDNTAWKPNTIPRRQAGGHITDFYNGTLSPLITLAEATATFEAKGSGGGGGTEIVTYPAVDYSWNASMMTNVYNNINAGKICVIDDSETHWLRSNGYASASIYYIIGAVPNTSVTFVGAGAMYYLTGQGYQTDDNSVAIITYTWEEEEGETYVSLSNRSMYSYDAFTAEIYWETEFPSSATSGTLTNNRYKSIINDKDRSVLKFNSEIYYKADVGHTRGYVTYTHTGYENNTFIHKAITINTNNWSWVLNVSE